MENMTIEEIVRIRGGVVRRRDLVSGGVSSRQLQRALEVGALARVGRGIYAAPDAEESVLRAALLGGDLACISAAQRLGLWVLRPPSILHVCLDHGRKPEDDVKIHRGSLPVTPWSICVQAMRCLPELDALCIVESAVVQGWVTLSELRELVGGKRDAKLRRIVALVDPYSQSLLETAARYPLKESGLAVQSQVYVKDVGRLDLLVEGMVGIEADGRKYHSGPTEFEEDRRRWNLLKVEGVPVLRVTYQQVAGDPDGYLKLVHSALARQREARAARPTRRGVSVGMSRQSH
ncbi:hypothetical protein GC088_12030 [Arthrobacter sp. JZ12]|nr:hypothetical protein GC088_12030 [Arthrobacter sp. JZ12]